MRLKIAALMMAVIAITATLGASAYTTGDVTRDSNVTVATDASGLIALSDGTSGDIVHATGGELAIDFTQVSASGFNSNANFTLGDSTDPTNSSAFSITNKDSTAHTFTVEYVNSITDDSTNSLQFKIYNSTGSNVATINEDATSSASLPSANPGETFYVVVVVDTTGVASGTDLSGKLKVSA